MNASMLLGPRGLYMIIRTNTRALKDIFIMSFLKVVELVGLVLPLSFLKFISEYKRHTNSIKNNDVKYVLRELFSLAIIL